MSDVIRLLPESIASQIAAGEVVTSPAAAVKELLENSIDAGATSIQLEVTDGGKASIHVLDNGCGMSPVDARMAFEKHATSKIRQADDLYKLHTMGFRGEALAAISAISQVELRTRQADSELGTELILSGSNVVSTNPCVVPVGTSMKVKDLFFNVPARRRFLRADKEEFKLIKREFINVALVNPSIAMSLYRDGQLVQELPASSLKERILSVAGRSFEEKLLPLHYTNTMVDVTGFVSSPIAAVKTRYQQYMFVNGRYMRHPSFQRAVEQAFEGLIPEGAHPNFFIYLTVPAENIDVNVSPTKTDIRFVDEGLIWTILKQLVRETLSANVAVPVINFDAEHTIDLPAYTGRKAVMDEEAASWETTPSVGSGASYARRVFMGRGAGGASLGESFGGSSRASSLQASSFDLDWARLSESFERAKPAESESLFVEPDVIPSSSPDNSELLSVGHMLYKGRYIVTSLRRNLVLIDLRRAHERIIYEQLLLEMQEGRIEVAQLMYPEELECSLEEASALEELVEDLDTLGFALEPTADRVYTLRQSPTSVATQAIDLIRGVLHHCLDTGQCGRDFLLRSLALSMAETLAKTATTVLDNQAVEDLLARLFASTDPNLSPRGRTIILSLTEAEIDNRFA